MMSQLVQWSMRINADPPISPKTNRWLQMKNIFCNFINSPHWMLQAAPNRTFQRLKKSFYILMSKKLNLEFPDSIQNIVSMLNNNLIKKPGLIFALEWDQDLSLKSTLLLFLLRATRGQHQHTCCKVRPISNSSISSVVDFWNLKVTDGS